MKAEETRNESRLSRTETILLSPYWRQVIISQPFKENFRYIHGILKPYSCFQINNKLYLSGGYKYSQREINKAFSCINYLG